MSNLYSSLRYLALLLTSLSAAALLTSCGAGNPLVLELSANKGFITPDSRGDRVDLSYRVNRPAQLSVSVVSKTGSHASCAPTSRDDQNETLRVSIRWHSAGVTRFTRTGECWTMGRTSSLLAPWISVGRKPNAARASTSRRGRAAARD